MKRTTTSPLLTAVQVAATDGLRLVPGTPYRQWMASTRGGFARRCLPMLLANQHGWTLLNGALTVVTWDGTPGIEGVSISSPAGSPSPSLPVSHFGSGIVTWKLPFLFRSSSGFDILLRGPANFPKDGAAPLEGIVETDWSPATATMNWMLTRPNHQVCFDVGDPIAMIVPIQRGQLEQFRTQMLALNDVPTLRTSYEAWRARREQFLQDLAPRENVRDEWQGEYFSGHIGSECPNDEEPHRTRLQLGSFDAERDNAQQRSTRDR